MQTLSQISGWVDLMETNMNLIYFPAACSLADHVALIEAGLPFKLISINQDYKTDDGRDLLSINPKGYTPVLETDDGTVLTENQVILAYIAELSGKLLPDNSFLRWRTHEALAYMSSEIHPAYTPFFRDFPEPEKARAREKVRKAFAILSKQMGDKNFLIGDELTIADCYLFWILRVAPKSGVELPGNLRACLEWLTRRPSHEGAGGRGPELSLDTGDPPADGSWPRPAQ